MGLRTDPCGTPLVMLRYLIWPSSGHVWLVVCGERYMKNWSRKIIQIHQPQWHLLEIDAYILKTERQQSCGKWLTKKKKISASILCFFMHTLGYVYSLRDGNFFISTVCACAYAYACSSIFLTTHTTYTQLVYALNFFALTDSLQWRPWQRDNRPQ